jgi:hypothetical protein
MIQVLNAGLSVDSLIELIAWRFEPSNTAIRVHVLAG